MKKYTKTLFVIILFFIGQISFAQTCSIGDRVWVDANGNGIQDAAETAGISGMTVLLKNSIGTIVGNTQTSSSGSYLFTGLAPDIYTVVFPTNYSGAMLTTQMAGSNASLDSDPNTSTGVTPNIVLIAGQSNMNVDAGYINFVVCSSCLLGYPDNTNLPKSAVVFNESDVLVAMEPSSTTCGSVDYGFIKLWYSDEHAMFLGVRSVVINRANGTTYTTNYPVTTYPGSPACASNLSFGTTILNGAQSGNDESDGGGRPLRPVLYLTDLTVNGSNSRIGDWQQGGTPYNSTTICGSWKSGIRTVDSTKNPVTVVITTDADPSSNGWNLAGGDAPPAGSANAGFGTEVKWDINSLGLIPGHAYRIQVMVHDGDQNKLGGDAGSMCTTIILPKPSVGNFVWRDQNNNGVQDAGESEIYLVDVNLYADSNGDNIPDGSAFQTTTTNSSGNYQFSELNPGKYIVGITIPLNYAAGTTTPTSLTPDNDNNTDNNGVTTVGGELRSNFITLTAGGEPTNDGDGNNGNLTLDFGLSPTDCNCVNSVGNLLTNGSFENGSTGWTVSGGSLTTGSGYVMCGSVNGFLSQSSGTAIMYQDVAAAAGSSVSFSGFSGTHTPGISCSPKLSLIFLNASNTVLLQSNITVTKDVDITGATLDYYTLSGIAPFGTTKVRVQGSIGCNTLKVDAFCLTITTPCPTTTASGGDQSKCGNSSFTMAATAAPTGATGTWSVFGGAATISSINSPTSIVTVTSSPATLRWTVSRTGCSDVYADVVLTNTVVTTAYAGPNQTINNTSAVMAANSPATGETGTWSVVTQPSGSPLITYSNVNSPTTSVNNMNVAGTYTFRWTITKGLCSSTCTVNITVNNPCIRGYETWPNSWSNNFVANLTNATATGSTGTWTFNTNANAAFALTAPYYNPSTSNALKIVNWRTDGVSPGISPAGAGLATAVSPTIDISNPCCPSGHIMQMTLWTYNVVSGDDNAWMGIDFSNDNGATWTTVFQKTSGHIFTDYGANTVITITIPVSSIYNVSNFRYRFRGESRINNPNNFYMFIDDILFLSPSVCNVLTLGNQVWYDANNNGIKDAGEPGLAGVNVDLYNSVGGVIQTTITDANGNYLFNNLSAGNYSVGAVIPPGYAKGDNGATNINADDQNDGTVATGGEARTTQFALTASSNNIDIGLKGTLNLGNLVWKDMSLNGLRETGEPGIDGVTLNLYYDANKDNVPDGSSISTATTSGGGFYGFSNVAPGSYIVGVVFPPKYSSSGLTLSGYSPNNDVDNDNNGVNLVTGGFRSNYITLTAGGEPTVDGDGSNGNLTLDFALMPDNDGDGTCDCTDIDDDNDGITDINESGGYDPLGDCDGDGIKNYLDPTPGCPTPSGNDPWGVPYKPLTWTDCNGDGINDFFDFDLDGVINEMDLDSDNDGIVDSRESRDAKYLDANNDGMIDGNDPDHNGLLSSAENGNPNPVLNGLQAQDLDRDGHPNFLDLDSDGDGITDIREAFLSDLNNQYSLLTATNGGITTGADIDNDGVRNEVFSGSGNEITADAIPGFGAKGIVPIDSDGDGYPNFYDIDSDNDGITDQVEGQPTCSYILPCTTDVDGDGLQDCIEPTTIANCTKRSGAGVTPADKDNDGTPDYLDLDTDNDGRPDINEGTGIAGNYVTRFTDIDKDGMLDEWDNFNILTATGNFTNNVGHNQMGTNGSTDGPVPSGSTAQLPQTAVGSCPTVDRDWRNTAVLPLHLISFEGAISGSIAKLYWITTQEANMNHYEVERSLDGIRFSTVGTVASQNVSAQHRYMLNDEMSSLSGNKVYYRLREVNIDNTSKYSQVISFNLQHQSDLSIHPNPANSSCVINLNCTKAQVSPLTISDMSGKIVRLTATVLVKGMNTIDVKELGKLAAGSYIIQIYTETDKLTGQLVIEH